MAPRRTQALPHRWLSLSTRRRATRHAWRCTVSNLCATIEATAVPLAPAAAAAIDGNAQRLTMALTGGDDYEVLFTAHPDETDRINALSQSSGIAITSIGRMSAQSQHEEPAVIVRNKLGEPLHFACEGWTHFGEQG